MSKQFPIEKFPLGQWIEIQRRWHAMKNTDKVIPLVRYPQDQVAKLESIPGWEWDPDAKDWISGFDASVKYGVVNEEFITEDGFELGKWQREKRQKCSYTAWRKLLETYVKGWYW